MQAEQNLTMQQVTEKIREIDPSILQMTPQILRERIQYIKQAVDFQKRELASLRTEVEQQKQQQREAERRLGLSKTLPMLISTVSELVDVPDAADPTKPPVHGVVIKTSSRQIVYTPSAGLVPYKQLRPGDLIAVNRDTFLIYEKLPNFYDARVKKMLVAERPTDSFDQVGGMSQILKQVDEAILMPFRSPELFESIGIQPSRGLLLYGPPGVGKTLIARCIANAADCIFLSLCATELIQVYIGEGSQILQEVFELAKEYVEHNTINGVPQGEPGITGAAAAVTSTSGATSSAAQASSVSKESSPDKDASQDNKDAAVPAAPERKRGALIYIDEIDAIGSRRFDSEQRSDREVARTLMTLLNLMDGFISHPRVKIIASTNRIDVLDPALVRSNRFDRKIECGLPNAAGRAEILRIHASPMKLTQDVTLDEIAKECDGFSGAMLRAVCTEAGMACLRRGGRAIDGRDFSAGIAAVSGKRQGDVAGVFM